jgi:hypothetical protein
MICRDGLIFRGSYKSICRSGWKTAPTNGAFVETLWYRPYRATRATPKNVWWRSDLIVSDVWTHAWSIKYRQKNN